MSFLLIVDDDEVFSDYIADVLMDEGHVVGKCCNGTEALSALNFRIPDLLILDCNMPEMCGIELLRKMRQDEKLCEVPVLMLTARTGKSDERIGFYEGATEYLPKPPVIEELLYMVDDLLERPVSDTPLVERLNKNLKPATSSKSRLV